MSGPYENQWQARQAPAVREIFDAFDADPGIGKMAPGNLAMLEQACAAAGVVLGVYDRQVIAWLAGWDPETCAVIAGLITRAAGGPR